MAATCGPHQLLCRHAQALQASLASGVRLAVALAAARDLYVRRRI